METSNVIQYYSEITKEEPLSTLEKEMTARNTCVLESTSPYFGYYHDEQLSKPEPFIYAVLEQYHTLGEIVRTASAVNEKLKMSIDVAPGRINLMNKSCPVLRIKGINHYRVKEIQEIFQEQNVVFKKRQRTIVDQMAVILLTKFLYLSIVGDGLYMDLRDETKGYFLLPEYINWEAFKKLTEEAKFETSILFFDAAKAIIFDKDQILNIARIYKKHIDTDQLKAIRDRYHKILK